MWLGSRGSRQCGQGCRRRTGQPREEGAEPRWAALPGTPLDTPGSREWSGSSLCPCDSTWRHKRGPARLPVESGLNLLLRGQWAWALRAGRLAAVRGAGGPAPGRGRGALGKGFDCPISGAGNTITGTVIPEQAVHIKLGFQTQFGAECGFWVKTKQAEKKHHPTRRSVCRAGRAGAPGTNVWVPHCPSGHRWKWWVPEAGSTLGWGWGGPAPAPGGKAAGARGADPERTPLQAGRGSLSLEACRQARADSVECLLPSRKVTSTQGHLPVTRHGFNVSRFSLDTGRSAETPAVTADRHDRPPQGETWRAGFNKPARVIRVPFAVPAPVI